MPAVYVSSTYADLVSYRQQVIGALRRMSCSVICMEDYGAADDRPLDKCLQDVDACEIYLGIFAWRYGFRPTENNPAGKSITELEYRRARDGGKKCLIFLIDEKQPWQRSSMDRGTEAERLETLRSHLMGRHTVGFFTTEADLAAKVVTTVHQLTTDSRRADKSGVSFTPEASIEAPPPTPGLKRLLRGHQQPVECVALSADSRWAASGSWDKSARLWNLETGGLVRQFLGHTGTVAHPGIVYGVAIRADAAAVISSGFDGTIREWQIDTGRQIRALTGHEGAVNSIALASDGNLLVSGGADRTVRVWDLDRGRETMKLNGHAGAIRSVAISADGSLAVSGGTDAQLRLWDLKGGQELTRFAPVEGAIFSVDLAADASIALSADINGAIYLWDVENGLEIRRFLGHEKTVRRAVMSTDLKRILSGSNDGTMRLWDLSSGAEIVRFDDHRCSVVAVAISRDGKTGISGAADNMVRLWDLPQ